MKNYFVVEIAEGDPKIAGYAIYGYDTAKEAKSVWHQKRSTAQKSDLYTYHLCMVTDAKGRVLKRENSEDDD